MSSQPESIETRKCIYHVDHCEKCGLGLGIYQETTLESYRKGSRHETEREVYCENDVKEALPDIGKCVACGTLPSKLDKKSCIRKPIKSDVFKLQRQEVREIIYHCVHHEDHCGVCGVGICNALDGDQVKTAYTWEGSQNVLYPEIDHYKCNQCINDSKGVLPHNSQDWSRKQSYLDYLFHKRAAADTSGCMENPAKRICRNVPNSEDVKKDNGPEWDPPKLTLETDNTYASITREEAIKLGDDYLNELNRLLGTSHQFTLQEIDIWYNLFNRKNNICYSPFSSILRRLDDPDYISLINEYVASINRTRSIGCFL
jgi:hypothetical protein